VTREAWLPTLGMAVTLARGVLSLPAITFAGAVSWLALRGSVAGGADPGEALSNAVGVWHSPRARSIALGLWLAGWLLWGALRVAWISGALPTLARVLSGRRDDPPAFAAGVAYRFERVLLAGLAALLLDLVGQAMLVGSALGAFALAPAARSSSGAAHVAVVVAMAMASSAFLAASLAVVGDAAVARAAIAGDGPGRALLGAVLSFLRRPSAFVAAWLGVWVAALLAAGSLQSLFSLLASFARRGPPAYLIAPQVMLAALSALLAAAAELWRLGAVGVLALGDGESGPGKARPAPGA